MSPMYDSNGAAAAADGQIVGEGASAVAEGAAGSDEAAAASEQHVMHHQQPPSNQLTLSFQGEVFVFDGVQPERVSKKNTSFIYSTALYECELIVQC